MLEHLEIRNYALIENLAMDFSEGFNVITGETGSGKSIILGALGLLMGEKADSSAVRAGSDEIVVNAVLSVPQDHEIIPWLRERSIELEDGALYIRRTVKASTGRSMIHVQGQMFTRQDLSYLADSLMDMHGQSEHQSLLIADRQRRILDSYCSNDSLLHSCLMAHREVNALEKRRDEVLKTIEENRKQESYLSFALEEIQKARILPDEDSDLREKVKVLSQFESIYENITLTTDKLREGRTFLYDSSASCEKAARCDQRLSDFVARIESARIEVEDIAEGLRDYLGSVEYSEEAINSMQDRLAQLQKLKRKYGPTLDDVLEFARNAENSMETAQNSEQILSDLEKQLDKAKAEYTKASLELSSRRKKGALKLEKSIEEVLHSLGMANARFRIAVNTDSDSTRFPQTGRDSVDFIISANPGEDLKSIRNIASGGELSRVMLALKTVLAQEDSIQSQVFDEVDSGIGGSVALSLASCMKRLSEKKQVIAITHLASIASAADSQFVVSKNVKDGRTYTSLKNVRGDERVSEIARMLSGDESELSLSHARMMLGMN